MLQSIIQRLELAEERFKFLEGEISSSRVISDQKTYSSYTKEYSDLRPLVEKHLEFKKIQEKSGLLTGYYEPIIKVSRNRDTFYKFPII